jgi:hypothetical protein
VLGFASCTAEHRTQSGRLPCSAWQAETFQRVLPRMMQQHMQRITALCLGGGSSGRDAARCAFAFDCAGAANRHLKTAEQPRGRHAVWHACMWQACMQHLASWCLVANNIRMQVDGRISFKNRRQITPTCRPARQLLAAATLLPAERQVSRRWTMLQAAVASLECLRSGTAAGGTHCLRSCRRTAAYRGACAAQSCDINDPGHHLARAVRAAGAFCLRRPWLREYVNHRG